MSKSLRIIFIILPFVFLSFSFQKSDAYTSSSINRIDIEKHLQTALFAVDQIRREKMADKNFRFAIVWGEAALGSVLSALAIYGNKPNLDGVPFKFAKGAGSYSKGLRFSAGIVGVLLLLDSGGARLLGYDHGVLEYVLDQSLQAAFRIDDAHAATVTDYLKTEEGFNKLLDFTNDEVEFYLRQDKALREQAIRMAILLDDMKQIQSSQDVSSF